MGVLFYGGLILTVGGFLRARLLDREQELPEHWWGYWPDLLVGLALVGVLILAIKGFVDFRIKERFFDGTLDNLWDKIDGSNDCEEFRSQSGLSASDYSCH